MLKKITLLIFFLVFFTGALFAQILISGQIVDDQKEPIAGASIFAKNNYKIGTTSDKDGYFKLKVKEGTILIVSFTGMKTQEVPAKKKLYIILQTDKQALKGIVVTGYQEIKKARMTGSIATISAKDIKNLDIKSMDQVLTGTIAGVSAITSGRPGAQARIQIRGINSLTGNTDPIWIVDGMPLQGETPNLSATGGNISPDMFQSGIGNISPDDIESITVLKDAAACAIYGARAANGVIVVKTKSGHAGKTNINVTAHFSVRERPHNNIRMMNSAEKIQFERQIFDDLSIYSTGRAGQILRNEEYGVVSHDQAAKQLSDLSKINTDWFKVLYHPALSSQINLSMSGGSYKTQYYNSLNILNEDGIEYNNKYRRARFNSKVSHRILDNLNFETDLSVTYRTNTHSSSSINSLGYALFANPYETPNGYDYSYDMRTSRIRPGLIWPTLNVLDDIKRNTASSRYLEGSLKAALRWKPFKGLELVSQGIFSASNNTSRNIEGAHTYTNFQNNWLNFLDQEITLDQVLGSLKESSSYKNSYTIRNTAEYNLDLLGKHFINIFGGQEISSDLNYVSFNYSPIFDRIHRIIGFPNLPEGIDTKKINFNRLGGTGRFESKLVSFFLSGSYSYMDRYVVNGSIRYDGADVIGNKNQFTPLWNISGKWNINNEKFFKGDFFNTLALKAGFGYTGSIDKNALPFVLMILDENINYAGMNIPTSFRYANPNVKWQTKRDINIGLESTFWESRAWFNVNFYNNLVFDLLDRKSLPLSSGRREVTENVADIRNRGWEFDTGIQLVRTNDLVWTIKANVAINECKILKTYYKNRKDIPAVTNGNGNSYFVEGYAVNSWFGYKFAEVDPYTGHTLVYGDDGKKFDMDRLQNVTLGLKAPTPTYLGQFIAPVIGGFSTSINWKRFIFNMNFEFRTGNYIRSFNSFRPLSSTNRYVGDMNRWRAPGDIASIPEISYNNQAYGKYVYDVSLERGDYIRNTYTSLGYNLSPSIARDLHLQYVRLTLSVMNAFTFTKYKGIDPTLMGSLGYPNTRTYSLSVNVGF